MNPHILSNTSSSKLTKSLPMDDETLATYSEHDSALYDRVLDYSDNNSARDSLNGSLLHDIDREDNSQRYNFPTSSSESSSSDNIHDDRNFNLINLNKEMADVSSESNEINAMRKASNDSFSLNDSTDSKSSASLSEVDLQSIKSSITVYKNDHQNWSNGEINENSIKEELANSVVVIEKFTDNESKVNEHHQKQIIPNTDVSNLVMSNKQSMDEKEIPLTNNPLAKPSSSRIQCLESSPKYEHDDDNITRQSETPLVHSSKEKLEMELSEALTASKDETFPESQKVLDDIPTATHNYPATKSDIKVYDTLDEFEKNLPSTVTILDTPFGSRVYLVGTAHFSAESQDDVSYVIRNVRPDVVMVELCPSRVHLLKLDEKTLLEEAKKCNLAKIRGILQTHGYINGLFFILMLQLSAQIAKDFGMAPGGEFRRAFAEIHKLPGCMLHLGDRPIQLTLNRATSSLSFWQTCKLVWRLTFSDKITLEELEEYKHRDLLEKLMEEMACEFPSFTEVFVNERDVFLCHSLQLAALPQTSMDSKLSRPVRVVGVIGMGHVKGIANMWGKIDPDGIAELLSIPKPSLSKRIAKYSLKYGLIGFTLYGAYKIFRTRFGRLY